MAKDASNLERLLIDPTGNVFRDGSAAKRLEDPILYCGAPRVVAVASPDDLHAEVAKIWSEQHESRANAYCANEVGLRVIQDAIEINVYAVQFYKLEGRTSEEV